MKRPRLMLLRNQLLKIRLKLPKTSQCKLILQNKCWFKNLQLSPKRKTNQRISLWKSKATRLLLKLLKRKTKRRRLKLSSQRPLKRMRPKMLSLRLRMLLKHNLPLKRLLRIWIRHYQNQLKQLHTFNRRPRPPWKAILRLEHPLKLALTLK